MLKVITETNAAAEELSSLLEGYFRLFVDPRVALIAGDTVVRSNGVRSRSVGLRSSMHLPSKYEALHSSNNGINSSGNNGSGAGDEDEVDGAITEEQDSALANVIRRSSEMNLSHLSRSGIEPHDEKQGRSHPSLASHSIGNLKAAASSSSIQSHGSRSIVAVDNGDEDYCQLDAEIDCDTIFRDQLTIAKMIGEGQFGSVNEGVWTRPDNTKIPVAIKTCKQEATPEVQREFLAEATLMSRLDHPHIVRILGVSLSSPMLIVCELMPLGSLRNYLLENRSTFNLKTLLGYNWQIVSAMSYLEHVKVVHR